MRAHHSTSPHQLLRLVFSLLACTTLGCSVVFFPDIIPTAVPTPTIAPTPTPLPNANVAFTVHTPPNSPPGTVPAVKILDPVQGTFIVVSLFNVGENLWTGTTQAPAGTLLLYEYVRLQPTIAEETTALQAPIAYRALPVGAQNTVADDVVAAWHDIPYAGEVGALTGRVWNSNTGQGAMGVWVEAGGQVAITAYDGSFQFFDLPPGVQRATAFAPDGSFRQASVVANVGPNQNTEVDLTSFDPNAVHVTLVVRGANLPIAQAPLRIIGNVWQLGSTWQPSANGALAMAARAPQMIAQADGSWAINLIFYEGTVVTYKYTLGDGAWNGELDSAGQPRLRRFVVPMQDAFFSDQITTWQTDGGAAITFEALTPKTTSLTDQVTIQFRTDRWLQPLPMWRISDTEWRYTLYNPTNFTGSVFYRYCRNYACGTADDAATAGEAATGRFFTPAVFGQDLRDPVDKWQWLDNVTPTSGVLPSVSVRPTFAAGLDLSDGWRPEQLASTNAAFNEMHNLGANWVTFTRLGTAQMRYFPYYADSAQLAPTAQDWLALAQQARNAGLRVALHPVTCHYTPYGNCEYWNGLNTGGEFWNQWFAAYERYILTQAELARQGGAELLVIGDYKLRPALPGEPEAPPDADARWRTLIQKVRTRYSGLLAFELLMGQSVWPNVPPFLDSVDVIRIAWWGALASNATPLVTDMTASAGALMDTNLLPLSQRFNKPIVISVAYYSADGGVTHCLKRADGQCHSFEDFGPNTNAASAYALDLQEQADAYSAVLTALNDRPWLTGFSSFGYNPVAILRDKSISVRGKPAEAVLSAWFLRLQGR